VSNMSRSGHWTRVSAQRNPLCGVLRTAFDDFISRRPTYRKRGRL